MPEFHLFTNLYVPSWNSVLFHSKEAESVHVWVYCCIIFWVFLRILLQTFPLLPFKVLSIREIIRKTTLWIFVVLMSFQIFSQYQDIKTVKKFYFGKTIDQKYLFEYGRTYAFYRFSLKHLPQHCWGELITDFDPRGTLEPYILKYFFYPRVNLIDQHESPSCLIIYQKFEPERFVPDDFEVVWEFDENSLVAVRKKP